MLYMWRFRRVDCFVAAPGDDAGCSGGNAAVGVYLLDTIIPDARESFMEKLKYHTVCGQLENVFKIIFLI